jgi:ssDNA-binding Zn-finger/Zn-ribbon topoisomerase 1
MSDELTAQQREQIAKLREAARSRLLGTDHPKCPYCLHENMLAETDPFWEEEAMPCEECGKTFIVCTERTIAHDNYPAGLCPHCGEWLALSHGRMERHPGRGADRHRDCPGSGLLVAQSGERNP